MPEPHLPTAGLPPLTPTSRSSTLAAYYHAGWLIADIMTHTGLSYRKIHAALRATNVTLRPPRQAVHLQTEQQVPPEPL